MTTTLTMSKPLTAMLNRILLAAFLALSSISSFAQTSVSGVLPANVSFRTQITISGNNLSGSTVTVNGQTATVLSTSATTIVAQVPEIALGAGVNTLSVPVVVTKSSVNYSAPQNITYVRAQASVVANAKVTRIITDHQGYWNSAAATTVRELQPDRQHSLMAMQYGGTIYSTGVNDAMLTSKGVSYTPGDFKALPVNFILGSTPNLDTALFLFTMGSRMDGSTLTANGSAPEVAGRKVKDVMIDGVKGLGLGTGMTNVPNTAVMEFVVTDIANSRINDAEPDIVVSQVANPSTSLDVFCFVDVNGNIVGNPVTISQIDVPAVGSYRVDLFRTTLNVPYANAVLRTDNVYQTNDYKDIRLVGYKLSEFGITSANKGQVAKLKLYMGGGADPAFVAYNANSMLIPAPALLSNPTSVIACTGIGTSTSFTVAASGNSLVYQWKKNGANLTDAAGKISGATTPTLTISNVVAADVAAYTCEISNPAGSILSNAGYLNTIISVQPAPVTTACTGNTGPIIDVIAHGLSLTYQWYDNGTNNTSYAGTAIQGATDYYYMPSASGPAGTTKYYYCVIENNGEGCVRETTTRAAFTIGAAANSGTAYIGSVGTTSRAVCPGGTTTTLLRVTGASSGTGVSYQWQQSADGVNGWYTVTGGTNATTVNYTTPVLTTRTFYRIQVTTQSCTVYSGVLTINVGSEAGTVSTDKTICSGTTTTVSVTGATGAIQWQQSADGLTGWANVTGGSGGTTATYTTPPVTTDMFYRASVVGVACSNPTSGVTHVGISPAAEAGTASGAQTICPNNSVTLSLSGATGVIQWEQSANGSTGWTNVTGGSGASSESYTTALLTSTMHYRAHISSGSCGTVNSNTVTVTVEDNFIWNGSVSQDWHDANNWSCNQIPDLNRNVTIPLTANQPIVSSTTMALAKSLTVQADAILTINTARNIQVTGAIAVATTGNIVVNNTANLIQDAAGTANQNIGKITVKRNSSQLFRQDYTLWSTPVDGQNLFQFSPQTVANRFYTYGTQQDLFVPVPGLGPVSTTTFATGVAYLIRMPNGNATAGYNAGSTAITLNQQFKGIPNDGTVTVPVSLETNRYNGVGNPYPSTINIHNFIDENEDELDNLGTLYFWRKKNNDANTSYSSINKTGYSENGAEGGSVGSAFEIGEEDSWVINPGQGFIIRATPGTTHVTFNNAMRRAVNNNQFFRAQQNNMSRYWLNINGAGAFGQTLVGYSNATTNGLDYGYDGPLLNDGQIAIYTNVMATDLSIQARGSFTTADAVPVTYKVTTGGTYTITLPKTDGIFETQDIFLKDSTTGTVHDLNEGAYSFATEAGTFSTRFEILYVNGALSTDKPVAGANTVVVYNQDKNLHINTGSLQMDEAKLYDTRGRLVHHVQNINAGTAVIKNLNAAEQVLVLQVTMQDGTILNKKVIF